MSTSINVADKERLRLEIAILQEDVKASNPGILKFSCTTLRRSSRERPRLPSMARSTPSPSPATSTAYSARASTPPFALWLPPSTSR